MGKGRARTVRKHGKTRSFTPKATAAWEDLAAAVYLPFKPKDPHVGPLELHVIAVGERPKRLRRAKDPAGRLWRCAKPDGDNVQKIVADSLKKARIIKDDIHIVMWRCPCVYAAKGEGPCTEIRLFRIMEEYRG